MGGEPKTSRVRTLSGTDWVQHVTHRTPSGTGRQPEVENGDDSLAPASGDRDDGKVEFRVLFPVLRVPPQAPVPRVYTNHSWSSVESSFHSLDIGTSPVGVSLTEDLGPPRRPGSEDPSFPLTPSSGQYPGLFELGPPPSMTHL